ncbi:MAG: FtsX-like permease family protein [Oscillospiraceae bacterium]|nr:FtsX-like permease family protein [Oscillospiraceae bacterium]
MNRCTWRVLLRGIGKSFGRYLAILSIVALGVGFFAGLKSSYPAMRQTAGEYWDSRVFSDFTLLSTLGFTEDDVTALSGRWDDLRAAEGGYFTDAYLSLDGIRGVYHIMSLPEKVDLPALTQGRLPLHRGECLADARAFSEADLGKTLILEPDNDEDTLDMLPGGRYTIVGLARSPRYISEQRGDTTLGSGLIDGFVFVPASAFDSEAFHELRLSFRLPGPLYSDAYTAARDRLEEEVKSALQERGNLRYRKLRAEADEELADARKELDDAWKEYNDAAAEAEEKLADALKKLDDAEAELRANEQELADSRMELEASMRDLPANRAEIASQRADLEAQAAKLDAQKQAALSEARTQIAQYGLSGEMAAAALAQAEAKIEEDLAPYRQQIAAGRAALDEGEQQLNNLEANYPFLMAKIDYSYGLITNGWYELAEGRYEYEDEKAKAEKELADAGRELLDGEAEYADAVAEAEEALELDLYTLDRESNIGYVTFDSDTRIIDALANVFPIFFVLVAALICITTMTRMVTEERTQIGTMKALGYSSAAIMSKYLLYSGSAALLGCVFGYFLGSMVIPYLVWIAYGIIYDYAVLNYYFSLRLFLWSLVVAVSMTVLVTWLACRQQLREKPAELIRPKAPKPGRRILPEYLGPLWRALPFLYKVSLRNAFRYPLRVLMMLLGIGGCTALLVAGFGVKDSISDLSAYQYNDIAVYQLSVNLDTDEFADDAAAGKLWENEAALCAMTWQEPVTLRHGELKKSTHAVACAPGALDGLINLFSDAGPLPFPGEGEAIITEKLADLLSLRVGEMLSLELDSGEILTLRVSGICKNYLRHYIYLNDASLPQLRHNTALLRLKEGADVSRFAAHLRGEDGISYVTLTSQERDSFEQSMASLDMMILLLIVCSGALAFITLYNLTNINIMERTREIATVKVLGFYLPETATYVLRENRLLAVLGALFGMLLGKGLHRLVIESVVVDNMTYEIRILPMSYLLSFGVTLAFTLFTNLIMHRRLDRVPMAESLKSVE